MIVDQAPDTQLRRASTSSPSSRYRPVIGEALWRLTPDVLVKEGLEAGLRARLRRPRRVRRRLEADDLHLLRRLRRRAEDDFTDERPLDERLGAAGVPLLVIFGAEEQIYEPREALSAYADVPGAQTG